MSKAKMLFKSKVVPSSKGRLNLLHMDLCGPMRVASINGKKYILVIVDDYSRYTWTLFLRSKDETPEVLKDFLTMIQRNLQAQVITVRTDRGTKFLNKTLHAYFKEEGIEHQTSTPRTPEQNGVVERRNRTLVEAARTMLLASKLPLSFWAEAVATACYTQNRSIIISTHGKTAYHILRTDFKEDWTDSAWIEAVQDELLQRRFYVAQQERVSCSRSSKKSSTLRKALLDLKSSKALDSGFELTAFSDVDHVGCIDTRKSTLGGYSALGDMPSKLDVKKQNACNVFKQRQSYVALSASCAQSAIAISCNPVQHSRTKHIHTRYHFIKEQVENGIIELYFVRTEYQLADMFTKALPEDRFKYLVRRIGMRCLTPAELEVLTNETA
ncbi:retrovirus-related pol polyprotein from transposon TNT 1-94 [Tanacetum coccineum]